MKTLRLWGAVSALGLALGNAQELKHFWDFEGKNPWDDKAGAAHGLVPAAFNFAPAEGKDGLEATAANFPSAVGGDADHLELDGAEVYQPGDEAFSFTYWFRIDDDAGTNPRGILDFSANGRDGVQSLFIGSTNELAFRVDLPGAAFSLVKVPMTEDGMWHFVAATYDPNGDLEVHVDGAGIDGTTPASGGGVVQNADPYLGSFNFTGTSAEKGLDGDLDNVAIYSGVLSDVQINGLFDGTISPSAFAPREEAFVITRIERVDGMDTLFWDSKPGGIYSVWSTSDLEGWGELQDSIDGTGEELSFSAAAADDVFYRVQDDTPQN